MTCTRREFGLLTLAGLALPAAARTATIVGGVRLGVQSYSFRDLPRTPGGDATAAIIQAMHATGLSECELWAPQLEPASTADSAGSNAGWRAAREALRRWRLDTPLEHFRGVRRRFESAGLSIAAYNYSPDTTFSDEEIDRGFEIAAVLGAGFITASTTLPVAARMAPFAARHAMTVSMHNHSRTDDPNAFATPDSFAAALRLSPHFRINLDIGHFTAANYDAVAFLRQRHAQVTNLHLKDRKKNQGDNVPWGEGDTPIVQVLRLLKQERWPIRAYVEYEHAGTAGPVAEVRRCVAFVRRALA
jgi:sugar phosphate isomerase/epimerase